MPLKIDPRSFPELDAADETADAGSTIVLAGGCFWCTEAVYRQLEGVLSVRPGYAGGTAQTARRSRSASIRRGLHSGRS